jgi:hypothetical protein
MIHIDKDLNNKPLSLRDTIFLNSLQEIIRDGNGNNIKEDIYKGKNYLIYDHTNNKMVRDVQKALKDLYYNKCAYCEKITTDPDIEHYRPKNAVMIPNISKKDSWTKLIGHNGYYWLAYEWSNLIISCPNCNRGIGGKHNQFPIIGTRIYSEIYLMNQSFDTDYFNLERLQNIEKPLLLHPEIDNPISHLIFKNDGKILGISQRGRATIYICNLNRPLLKNKRWKKIKKISKKLKILIEDYLVKKITSTYFKNQLKIIFENIKNDEQGHREFTLLAKNMFERFEYFFISQFKNDKVKQILTELLNRYKNNTL